MQLALRSGRTRRKPQRKPGERYQRFTDEMIMISERPAEVEDRAVPGHWEGDLIVGGAQHKSAIGTLVERNTRYTMLLHLPDGHDAETVRDALIASIGTLPEHLRGIVDLGSRGGDGRAQAVQHGHRYDRVLLRPGQPVAAGVATKTPTAFCASTSRSTDLSIYGPEDLEHVAQELNGRPRKTLGWDTPAERLRNLVTTQ